MTKVVVPPPPSPQIAKPQKRKITHLVVHCTATSPTASIQGILDYWRNTNGWKNPGYHIIIPPGGKSQRLLDDSLISNGVGGHNAHSLHVSYVGGIDEFGRAKDTRTANQKSEILRILKRWKQEYPDAIIQGHRDFPNVKKSCPSFNAKDEYKSL